MGSMALAYLIMVLIVYGGLLWKWPKVMRCYPLCRLGLFGLLMPIAMYTNQHGNLPISIGVAFLLGSAMTTALAMPLIRRSHKGPPPSEFDVSPANYGGEY